MFQPSPLEEGFENFTNCFSPKPSTTISRGIANIALESTISLEKVAKLHRTGAGKFIEGTYYLCYTLEYSSLQPFMMLHVLGEASYLREITVIRPSPTKCSLVACLGIFQNKTCWPPFVHLVQSALSGLEKKALVFPRGTCMLYLIMNVK